MAGEWIKMRWCLRSEPEVIAMADKLGLDEDHIVGKLHAIWSWAEEHTKGGNAPGVTFSWLDRYVCVTGFAQTMLDVGWLETNGDGLTIPRFEVHMGQVGKNKALTARRAVTHRQRKRNARSVTSSSSLNTTTYKTKKKTRTKGFLPDAVELPIEGEAFAKAWKRWCDHRREIRKPLTPRCCEQQLAWCVQVGKDRAIAALCHTIRQGWTGIREDDQAAGRPQRGAPAPTNDAARLAERARGKWIREQLKVRGADARPDIEAEAAEKFDGRD